MIEENIFIYLIHNPVGGAWQRQKEIFAYQMESKMKAFLICFSDSDSKIVKNLYLDNVFLIPNIQGLKSFIYPFFSSIILIYLITKFRYIGKRIVSFEGNAGAFASLINKICPNTHFTSFLRGAEKFKMQRNSKISKILNRIMLRYMVKNSELVLFQSISGKNSFLSDYFKKGEYENIKIQVLNNNCNSNWIEKNISCINKDTKLILGNSISIVFLGQINFWIKGLDILLVAIKELLNHYNFKLDIIGTGPDMEKLEKFIAYNGMGKICTIHGYNQNPYTILYNCNLMIIPSRSEPFPNALLEGIRIGIPILGANIDGIKEIISDDSFLFQVGDSGDLKNKIELYLKEPKMLNINQAHIQSLQKKYSFNWNKLFLEHICN